MDIQRHLNHEPVVACPPSKLYRFQKVVRRNKLEFAAAGAVAAALVIGFGFSTWSLFRERIARKAAVRAQADEIEQRHVAEKQKAIAEESAAEARNNLYAADMLLAQQGVEE